MIVPLIKEYLDVSVKNDDSLIKMASIIQRAMINSGGGSDDFTLSDSEKEQLLKAVQTMEQEIPKPILTHGDSNNKK
jgi:hypothetical protein